VAGQELDSAAHEEPPTAVSVSCLKPDVNPESGAVPFAACLCGGKPGAEHLKPDAEKDPSC